MSFPVDEQPTSIARLGLSPIVSTQSGIPERLFGNYFKFNLVGLMRSNWFVREARVGHYIKCEICVVLNATMLIFVDCAMKES